MKKFIAILTTCTIAMVCFFTVDGDKVEAREISKDTISETTMYKEARTKPAAEILSSFVYPKKGYYTYAVVSSYLDAKLPTYAKNHYALIMSPVKLNMSLNSSKTLLSVNSSSSDLTKEIVVLNSFGETKYTLEQILKGVSFFNVAQTGLNGIHGWEYLGRNTDMNSVNDGFTMDKSWFYDDVTSYAHASVAEWEDELTEYGYKYMIEVLTPMTEIQATELVIITSPQEFTVKGVDNGGPYGDKYLELSTYESKTQLFRVHSYNPSSKEMYHEDLTVDDILTKKNLGGVFEDKMTYDMDYGPLYTNSYAQDDDITLDDEEDEGNIFTSLIAFLKEFFQFVLDGMENIINFLGGLVESVADMIVRLIIPNDERINEIFADFQKSVDKFFGPIWEMIDVFSSSFNSMVAFEQAPMYFYQGKDIFGGFRDFMDTEVETSYRLGNYGTITPRNLLKLMSRFFMGYIFVMWFLRRFGQMTKGETTT